LSFDHAGFFHQSFALLILGITQPAHYRLLVVPTLVFYSTASTAPIIMWQSMMNSDMAKGFAESLEKAGDVITKGATNAARRPAAAPTSSRSASTSDSETQPPVTFTVTNPSIALTPQQKELAQKLKDGWGSLVQTTKTTLKKTQEAVEKEHLRLAARLKGDQVYRRDPSLPLDVEALRDAEVVYITDRLLTMSHPAMQSTVDGDLTPTRKLAAVGQLLNKRHAGKFMVWNMSEVDYDVSVLDEQVLTFSFPGSPSPPLGLLLKLLISIESWLKADDQNVAVLHCLTGKGRTSTVLAAFLCWVGEAGFADITSALEYIARCKHLVLEDLIIPSQRRYASYFANMLDGVRPSQPPLMLKRIIMTSAPAFARGPPRPDLEDDDASLMGCAPYLQMFKAGQLVFTTAAIIHPNQPKDELPFCAGADGPISFHVENIVQGDILIRCRHLTVTGQRVSMFRAGFHTGYVPPNVLRLSKAQLDGACSDKRFPNDFHIDLIFEACDAEMAAKHLSGKTDASDDDDEYDGNASNEAQNEAKDRRQRGTNSSGAPSDTPAASSNQGAIVTASAYDSMLHRDSRFWDVIAARRQEHATWTDAKDPLWGPTIGRRRDFSKKTTEANNDETKNSETKLNALESFSIGGDSFNFDSFVATPKAEPKAEEPKERDELMEALMALDDETLSPIKAKETKRIASMEEVVFEGDSSESKEPGALFKFTEETAVPEAAEDTAVNEVADLLEDANLDLDTDVDAFLAGAEGNVDGGGEDVDLDDFDFDDDDDDDIEDLEKFLSK
jgi:C2 domain of PTEN tumour-suppressor protein